MSFSDFILLIVSILASGIASISGFGIGSLITPLLSFTVGTQVAIVLVAIPHLIATGLRFWMLKGHLNKKIFWSFGLMSALGGLTGALLHVWLDVPALTLIFSLILLFAGFMGLTGLSTKMRFAGRMAWAAGTLSGFLGGLVGNQGGIRSAALLSFSISKESIVATATAVGLIIDSARIPIYLWSGGHHLTSHIPQLIIMSLGCVIGTFVGGRLLRLLPEALFKKITYTLIFSLGLLMLYQAIQ